MATEQYFLFIPDLPNAPRLSVRPRHLARAAQQANTIKMGGAFLSEQPKDNADATSWGFEGSAMIGEFPAGTGVDGVRKYLQEDPYVIEGVWDLDKSRIIPFKTVFSTPK